MFSSKASQVLRSPTFFPPCQKPFIRVIAVCPGYVWTTMREAEYTPEMKAAGDANISAAPHATPGEIAALFAFLTSDEAPYITEHPVIIDGGEIAGGFASR